jgi:ATP-dependent DNA helicase RecQ
MKADHPISINKDRKKGTPGGDWESIDPVSRGKVQILPCENDPLEQALVAMSELQRLAKLSPDWDWSKAAVIAREWSYLEPVRSYCEMNNMPVQMADEQPPPIWRLRETQKLMEWIEGRNESLIDAQSIQRWLEDAGTGPWWDLLREIISALKLEIGKSEISIQNFTEWVVEWGREFRRSQNGLLLLTAHRAKGLEFDHLIVLDGAWGKIGKDEDKDASRRLYYVAMTRARQTLSLLRFNGKHQFIDDRIINTPQCTERKQIAELQQPYGLDRKYLRLTLKDVDMGFAGRFAPHRDVHGAISRLQPRDEIQLRHNDGKYELFDLQGALVGRLAKAFVPPKNSTFASANIIAIVERDQGTDESEYQSRFKCDKWEVVLPELVYAKDNRN